MSLDDAPEARSTSEQPAVHSSYKWGTGLRLVRVKGIDTGISFQFWSIIIIINKSRPGCLIRLMRGNRSTVVAEIRACRWIQSLIAPCAPVCCSIWMWKFSEGNEPVTHTTVLLLHREIHPHRNTSLTDRLARVHLLRRRTPVASLAAWGHVPLISPH